jgi:hypothetical protein
MASLERPDGEQRAALVHELSESGALLLVRTTRINVKDEVVLHLHEVHVGETSMARGVVVRVEELPAGESGPWLRRVAMRFLKPLQMRDTQIEGFRRRVERLGIAR